MRAVTILASAALAWFPAVQAAQAWCDPEQAILPPADLQAHPVKGSVGSDGLSSFGGVTLSFNPRDVEAAMGRIGIVSVPTTFVSAPEIVASFDFCKNDILVGSMDFDYAGAAKRIVLNASFFVEGAVQMREFADSLFAAYSVRVDESNDDSCFQDVACFRGTTKAGERFLLLDIGHQIQLYVMPPK